MATRKQRQSSWLFQKILQSQQRKGKSKMCKRELKSLQEISFRCYSVLWWRPTKMFLLWGNRIQVSYNSSYQERWCKSQKGNETKILLGNIRISKKEQLSYWLWRFMLQLQFSNRTLWSLST